MYQQSYAESIWLTEHSSGNEHHMWGIKDQAVSQHSLGRDLDPASAGGSKEWASVDALRSLVLANCLRVPAGKPYGLMEGIKRMQTEHIYKRMGAPKKMDNHLPQIGKTEEEKCQNWNCKPMWNRQLTEFDPQEGDDFGWNRIIKAAIRHRIQCGSGIGLRNSEWFWIRNFRSRFLRPFRLMKRFSSILPNF